MLDIIRCTPKIAYHLVGVYLSKSTVYAFPGSSWVCTKCTPGRRPSIENHTLSPDFLRRVLATNVSLGGRQQPRNSVRDTTVSSSYIIFRDVYIYIYIYIWFWEIWSEIRYLNKIRRSVWSNFIELFGFIRFQTSDFDNHDYLNLFLRIGQRNSKIN